MRVTIKYCGSCNPHLDLDKISGEMRTWLLSEGFTLVPLDGSDLDLLLILNGCETACADRSEVRARARKAVIVAGKMLDGSWVPERDISLSIFRQVRNRIMVYEI